MTKPNNVIMFPERSHLALPTRYFGTAWEAAWQVGRSVLKIPFNYVPQVIERPPISARLVVQRPGVSAKIGAQMVENATAGKLTESEKLDALRNRPTSDPEDLNKSLQVIHASLSKFSAMKRAGQGLITRAMLDTELLLDGKEEEFLDGIASGLSERNASYS